MKGNKEEENLRRLKRRKSAVQSLLLRFLDKSFVTMQEKIETSQQGKESDDLLSGRAKAS